MNRISKNRAILVIAFVALTALACDLSSITSLIPIGASGITDAVLAKEIKPKTNEPVGITDTFPSDQKELHAVVTIANAPKNTQFRAVWTAVDTGGAFQPNSKLTDTQGKFEGSQNLDFSLKPNRGTFPPGQYKVEIYMNDNLERTLTFTIEGTPQARATETPRAQAPTPTARSSPSAGGGIITNAVMARDVTVITSAPKGATDTFPNDQKVYHAVVTIKDAPRGTSVKAAWSPVDVGNARAPQLGDYTSRAEGSQNLDFTYTIGSDPLPPGKYKVEISLNDKLDRTLNFTVAPAGTRFPSTPTPGKVGNCPPPPPPNYRPPIIATKITMAEGTTGPTLDPVNPGRFFKPSTTFYAIVRVENAPASTKVKAVWYAQDVGDEEPCNTRIEETELTTSETHNLAFSLRPPAKWPLGIYRVEIYVNGNLNIDVDFRVQ